MYLSLLDEICHLFKLLFDWLIDWWLNLSFCFLHDLIPNLGTTSLIRESDKSGTYNLYWIMTRTPREMLKLKLKDRGYLWFLELWFLILFVLIYDSCFLSLLELVGILGAGSYYHNCGWWEETVCNKNILLTVLYRMQRNYFTYGNRTYWGDQGVC